jgi:hypothetical protein
LVLESEKDKPIPTRAGDRALGHRIARWNDTLQTESVGGELLRPSPSFTSPLSIHMPHALLVDDNAGTLDALSELVRAEGFTVSVAPTIEGARLELGKHKPETLVELVSSDKLFRSDIDQAYAEAWALTFYLSQTQLPVPALGSWNILVGFGIMFIGFLMTTRWR